MSAVSRGRGRALGRSFPRPPGSGGGVVLWPFYSQIACPAGFPVRRVGEEDVEEAYCHHLDTLLHPHTQALHPDTPLHRRMKKKKKKNKLYTLPAGEQSMCVLG
jgi:hypothetical protein